jgi:hypothetical protein
VTHNSLAANQCPNISLIDRRHFDDAALPIRIAERCTTGVYVNGRGGHSRLDSIKPYQRSHSPATRSAAQWRTKVVRCNALLGVALVRTLTPCKFAI